MPSDGFPAAASPHLVRLPGTRWQIWRESGLRSAGFPAARIAAICDPRLVEIAEAVNHRAAPADQFATAYVDAAAAATAALRALAADTRIRAAIAWQNPELVRNWLRRFAFPPSADSPAKRKHLLPMTRYVQRYLVKNETIGFFGPVAWASWTGGSLPIRVRPGDSLLASRTLYFETWTIDALAQALSDDHDIQPWISPRLVAACLLDGKLVRRPYGDPLALSPTQAMLLRLCDGSRTVRDITGRLHSSSPEPTDRGDAEKNIIAQLADWRDQGIVHFDLTGPVEARPEQTLRMKLNRIEAEAPRRRALDALSELESCGADVAAAADNPERLLAAMDVLGNAFERLTHTRRSRRHGQAYAGRTLVYEDTRRAVDVELGRPLLEAVGAPLGLVLDSAQWLISRAAEAFDELFWTLFQRFRERSGHDQVPLTTLLATAIPHFHRASGALGVLAPVVAEFQERWSRVLSVPPGANRHTVAAHAVAGQVRDLFPSAASRWAGAVHFSPDLMVAALGTEAIVRGDYLIVLGELHLATNTLESRPFVEQHPASERLLRAITDDHAGRRIYSVPTKEWPQVNSRTYPSALLSPSYTYWCLHSDTGGAPGPVLPAAGLAVRRSRDALVVRHLPDGREFPLLEVLGEQLSWVVANGFMPVPAAAHQPRIAIDRFVIHRESWSFDAADIAWMSAADPAERFLGAQAWRAAHALPIACFYKVPGERKPVFVNFSSVPLVECLAQAVHWTAASDGDQTVSFTEALPDPRQTWLIDGGGAGYTAELRLVAVDPGAATPAAST